MIEQPALRQVPELGCIGIQYHFNRQFLKLSAVTTAESKLYWISGVHQTPAAQTD